MDAISLSTSLPATPRRVYQAWLDSKGHSAFTGAEAELEPRVGGRHRAWEGYISGRILELEENRRIVMTWRTTEFPPGSPDSRVEMILEPVKGGTRLTFLHSQIPPGDGPKYDEGWRENYFEPMRSYFRKKGGAISRKTAGKRSAKRARAKERPGRKRTPPARRGRRRNP